MSRFIFLNNPFYISNIPLAWFANKEYYPFMKWKETWELPSIPDPVFWPEVGRRRGQVGGQPKKLRPCEFCGNQFGAREMQYHLPRCQKRPNSRKSDPKGKN